MANEVLCLNEFDVKMTILACRMENFHYQRIGMTIYFWR